ncbi:MAG: type IX secretion system membrane protein PorP/SprF [Bacteroidota bacterium]
MRRLVYISCLLILFALPGKGQQAPLYSQYMLNGFLMNPAVAGSEGYSAINLTAREQWAGFQGGPSTYALSFQTRVMKKSHISRTTQVRRRKSLNSKGGKVGLGGYIFNHRNGAVERIGIKGTYAYHIRLSDSQLSFGLSMVAYQYKLNDDKIRLESDNDGFWEGARKSVLIPDADVGVYFTTRDFWAGFSVDQLLESVLKFGDAGYDQFTMERTYYLMGGYDFQPRRDVILTPSALVKYAENGKLQADLSAKLYFSQTVWTGLTYRTGSSVIVMAGVSVDRLIFGYAFDIGLNSIMKHSFGTHEFTFIAKLGDNVRRFRWLNRF